ncbi:3-oxoacyl-[acyl-carrier-protein] synthase III C-terminal domain-containing protein [Paraherbaspirillum soli]|uniref:3-oxoacyl-[acyl-carrier-protein] synthase III C-terminal domain-containing protein n=1 Tax=Paraherbaspirillum soli TaxID=631222 RepID=A0ABW0MDQ8_9BURK
MIPVRLVSTGKALPSEQLSSEQLDQRLGHAAGHTFKASGVRLRHVAAAAETQSQLAAAALHDALKNASLPASSIDLLISACGVQEQALPSTACFIAEQAGLKPGTPAFDVNASCLSFMAGLRVAAGLLATGGYTRIALVSSDLASRGVDWSEPEASLIFGDGAAAVILEKGGAGQGIRAFKLETYPEGRSYCEIRAGGTRRNPRIGVEPGDFLFRMDGKAVFKLASKLMPSFLSGLMAETGDDLSSIDVVVPHQASHLGMAHAAKRLGIPAEKVVDIYATHGNQVAASIPTALHEAVISGRAKPGTRALLMGTAAGLTIGGLVLDL